MVIKKFSKSQVAVEYMFVIGFATLITIPLLMIYISYSQGTSDSVSSLQSLSASRKIVDSAESVYYLGKPSQTTVKINVPQNVQSISIGNKEINFRVKTKNGVTDIVQVSSVNITGSISNTQGIHTVTIRAEDGYVDISSN